MENDAIAVADTSRMEADKHVEKVCRRIAGMKRKFKTLYEGMQGGIENEVTICLKCLAESYANLIRLLLSVERPSIDEFEKLALPFETMNVPHAMYGRLIPKLAQEFFEAQDLCIATRERYHDTIALEDSTKYVLAESKKNMNFAQG